MEDPRIGRVLGGRYRVVEKLASGGMGTVYRGEREGLGRAVAIKFLHPLIAQHADTRRRFETEAKAASRLTHPNCAAVTDFGIDEGSPYLVMEFIVGITLREAIDAGPMEPARALGIAAQLLAGLAHAHGHQIVHRDIKPENIILTEVTGVGDQLKILDFGLAKLDGQDNATTGFAIGTPSYMAPEQTTGDPVDARTDLYAVGVVLFEMLTGKPPFAAKMPMELFRLHRESAPPRIPGAAPELEAALAKALAKRPDDRFASARDFAAAIEKTRESYRKPPAGAIDLQAVADRTIVDRTPLADKPPARRRKWWLALGAIPIVGLAVVLIAAHAGTPKENVSPAPAPVPAAPVSTEPPIEIEDTPAEADQVPGLDDLERSLAGAGGCDLDSRLVALRTKFPKSARVKLDLGHCYFLKLWWRDGLATYQAAVAAEPSYRSNPILIKDLVRGLVGNAAGESAQFIREQIGTDALPFLDDAAAHDSTINVRNRAKALAAELRGAR